MGVRYFLVVGVGGLVSGSVSPPEVSTIGAFSLFRRGLFFATGGLVRAGKGGGGGGGMVVGWSAKRVVRRVVLIASCVLSTCIAAVSSAAPESTSIVSGPSVRRLGGSGPSSLSVFCRLDLVRLCLDCV